MSQCSVRKFNFNDAPAIARLNLQWGYITTVADVEAKLTTLQSIPDNQLFIAEENNAAIGWLHVCRHFSMGPGAYAEIAGLVVDEKYRGKGIAKLLIEQAKQWAKQNGLNNLKVRTNIKRPEASLVYPKCGFTLAKQQNAFEMELK